MNKKIVKESVGRDLVGASNYASRSSVVHKILLKYPDPTKLSAALAQMSKESTDPRVQKKCAELSAVCRNVDIQQYPKFVEKVAGLSKLWSVAAKTIGAAAAGAGTYYLVKTMSDVANTDDVKNAQGIGGKASALLKGTGNQISSDIDSVKNNVSSGLDRIHQWGHDKAKEAATAVSKKADQLSGAKADRASIKKAADVETKSRIKADANEAHQRAMGDKEEMIQRKAADLDAAIARDKIAAKAAADTAAEAQARANADTKAAEHVRRRFNSVNARIGTKQTATPSISDAIPSKEDLKQAYKDAYGPTVDKAKELSKAAAEKASRAYDTSKENVKNWLNRFRDTPTATMSNAWLYR